MFVYPRRVEFRDTDCAGILHFSVYLLYMEEAEHALLRHLGTSVHRHEGDGVWSWPRVATSFRYSAAARFEDVVEVKLGVRELGRTSVVYESRFELHGREIAQGSMTSVYCWIARGQSPKKHEIPADLRRSLEAYLLPAES